MEVESGEILQNETGKSLPRFNVWLLSLDSEQLLGKKGISAGVIDWSQLAWDCSGFNAESFVSQETPVPG